jgi:hypothetical protein
MRRVVILPWVLALLLFSGASEARTAGGPSLIAQPQAATAVASYGDVQAWSDYDPMTKLWHVAVRRGGAVSTLPNPASRKPIEVDVGPGPRGNPVLAYTACSLTCEVVVSAVDGRAQQVVPGARGASHPTIWGHRVAWVHNGSTVMSSLLTGAERRRIGGAPRRKCYEAPSGPSRLVCQAPGQPTVEALQLAGRTLALVDSFMLNDGIGASGTTTEVRLEPVTGGRQRLVSILTVGEGNERWIGPSWLGGVLYFYEVSDEASIGQRAVFRFDPSHGSYMRAASYSDLAGFGMIDARHALEATAAGDPRYEDENEVCGETRDRCSVQLSEPLRFKPIPAHALLFTP